MVEPIIYPNNPNANKIANFQINTVVPLIIEIESNKVIIVTKLKLFKASKRTTDGITWLPNNPNIAATKANIDNPPPTAIERLLRSNQQDVKKHNRMGGTNYAPVMADVDRFYIEEEPLNIPNYVIFITDGDNTDRARAESMITKISNHPIFFQFIGVGNSSFSFLEKLDEMDGRYIDNANFFSVSDINSMSDDDLYDKLFAEFPSWLKDSKVQDMLKDVKSLANISNITTPKKKGFFARLFGK